jgi:acetyltransferase
MAFRVLGRLREVTPAMLVRLTQPDYDREIALVALDPAGQLAGVVRYAALPDRSEAEFAALVSAGFKGAGLGAALMRQLIAYARSQGIGALVGLTNADNAPMLALARELGFRVQSEPGEPGLLALRLSLLAP